LLKENWFLFSFLALICWGGWGFLPKLTVRYISTSDAVIFQGIGNLFFLIIVLFYKGFSVETDVRGITSAFFTGLLGILGSFFYLMAIERGKISVVVTLTALYPVLTVILAYFFLNEPVTLKEIMGIFFACISILFFTI